MSGILTLAMWMGLFIFASDWPMLYHDPAHTSCTTDTGPNTKILKWSYQTGGAISEYYLHISSPAVVGTRLYVGSNSRYVYCFDAINGGAPIWSRQLADTVYSSPAVAGGRVYVGTWNGYMYCLDAENGDSLWRYNTNGWIEMGASVANGRVYFGAWYQNYIWCLDAVTGALIWRGQPESNFMFTHSMPAVHDSLVFMGASKYMVSPTKFYAMKEYPASPPAGEIAWRCSLGTGVQHQPLSVGNGRVFGSVDDGYLYAMKENPSTYQGEVLWSIVSSPGGGGDPSCVSIKGDTIYYGHERGYVYARRASDGGLIWSQSSLGGHSGVGAVVITPSRLYVGTAVETASGKVICYDRASGDTIWTYQTGGSVTSTPAVVNGMMYVTSQDGYLYAFGDVIDIGESGCLDRPGFSVCPNIVRKGVNIIYCLNDPGYVSIKIYDLAGREIKVLVDGDAHAGEHRVFWDRIDNENRRVGSGAYICRFRHRDEATSLKLIIVD